jgi:N-formylglutamate deformylase
VVDGRFRGGHITRHYGQPSAGIHAVQLEMCMHCYMDDGAPFAFRPERAEQILPVLRAFVSTMIAWRPGA